MDEIVTALHSWKNHVPIYKVIIIGFISFVFGALITYFSLSSINNKNEMSNQVAEELSYLDVGQTVDDFRFLDGENAYVYAEVATLHENLVTLRKGDGQYKWYPLLEQFFVSKPGKNTSLATSSGQLTAIETGKWATVNLRKLDGEYQIVSILYR
jgi:hypothetical protein